MFSIAGHQRDANENHNEMPFHTSQNGHHKHVKEQQVLERMWRKGNPSALLVGMQTGAATVENSMDFPQKTKHGTALLTQQFRCWDYTLRTLKHQSKRTCAPNVHSSTIYNSQVLEAT